ncbi:MAG: glycosyltransferase [Kiritimatiellae bacterium]|nr:glycosyltransferase [Kiritimatiellia bacterium]
MDVAKPLVTIVLPTCNRRHFLPAAIRSILDQSFRDWRLLVVNDGGEDVSDIVSSFGDSRIELHDRPHLGKAAALNAGLALAGTKYIAYMDDDDIVYPDHLAELVALAEKENAEFVHSDTWAVYLDSDGREIRRRVENDADVSFEDIRLFNRINHKQILHTKRLADEVGPYDERLRILIDYDYIRRLAKVCPPVHLRKITGEHFLRQAAGGEGMEPASITGLWASDPAACGRSLAALFEKDPEAIAAIYREAIRFRAEARRHGKTREVLEKTREALGKTRGTLEKTRGALEKTRGALEKTRAALQKTRTALEKTREALRKRTARLEAVEASAACRIGRLATAPFRPLRALFRRVRRAFPRTEGTNRG